MLHQDVHQGEDLPSFPSRLECGGGAVQLLVAVHLLHLASEHRGLDRLQAAALAQGQQGQQGHPSSLPISIKLTDKSLLSQNFHFSKP